MVLHVSVPHGEIRDSGAFEFVEDVLVGFAENVGEYVQAASVGHADHHFFDTEIGRVVDSGVECGDGVLSTLKREAFLTYVLGVQEIFKRNSFVEFSENAFFLFNRERDIGFFNLVLEPLADLVVVDVIELKADGSGVNLMQTRLNVFEFCRAQTEEVSCGESFFEIITRETEVTQLETWVAVFSLAHGIGF